MRPYAFCCVPLSHGEEHPHGGRRAAELTDFIVGVADKYCTLTFVGVTVPGFQVVPAISACRS